MTAPDIRIGSRRADLYIDPANSGLRFVTFSDKPDIFQDNTLLLQVRDESVRITQTVREETRNLFFDGDWDNVRVISIVKEIPESNREVLARLKNIEYWRLETFASGIAALDKAHAGDISDRPSQLVFPLKTLKTLLNDRRAFLSDWNNLQDEPVEDEDSWKEGRFARLTQTPSSLAVETLCRLSYHDNASISVELPLCSGLNSSLLIDVPELRTWLSNNKSEEYGALIPLAASACAATSKNFVVSCSRIRATSQDRYPKTGTVLNQVSVPADTVSEILSVCLPTASRDGRLAAVQLNFELEASCCRLTGIATDSRRLMCIHRTVTRSEEFSASFKIVIPRKIVELFLRYRDANAGSATFVLGAEGAMLSVGSCRFVFPLQDPFPYPTKFLSNVSQATVGVHMPLAELVRLLKVARIPWEDYEIDTFRLAVKGKSELRAEVTTKCLRESSTFGVPALIEYFGSQDASCVSLDINGAGLLQSMIPLKDQPIEIHCAPGNLAIPIFVTGKDEKDWFYLQMAVKPEEKR